MLNKFVFLAADAGVVTTQVLEIVIVVEAELCLLFLGVLIDFWGAESCHILVVDAVVIDLLLHLFDLGSPLLLCYFRLRRCILLLLFLLGNLFLHGRLLLSFFLPFFKLTLTRCARINSLSGHHSLLVHFLDPIHCLLKHVDLLIV